MLSSYTKTVFTARADDSMLAFGFWQSQDGFAVRTFFIDMRFSITEFIAAKLKETAESVVFTSALSDITREHTEKYDVYKRN